MSVNCAICGAALSNRIAGFEALQRVTSDCKPYPAGGSIAECGACGAVQKPGDAAWQADCDAIYGAYDNYSLTGGIEQSVRGGPDGQDYAPRSDLVLGAYDRAFGLPASGRMLDYGCGKGPTTRSAARILTGWTIDGYDLDRRAEDVLSAIPAFGSLFTGAPEDIPHRYDLIVLMHALEHIPDGPAVLAKLGRLLTPGGHIVVQVPNRIPNPFDLLVADHVVHFDPAALHGIARAAGLAPVVLAQDWVVKELSLVAGQGADVAQPEASGISAQDQVSWLKAVASTVKDAAAKRPFGIFGTSIIGTWMASELPAPPDFYLDEDPAKQGRAIDGVPILAPDQAPTGAVIAPAMAPQVARAVAQRLQPLGLHFVDLPDAPAQA